MQNLPSVHIPESIPPCDVCRKGYITPRNFQEVSLEELRGGSESGCSVCRLRYLAIYRSTQALLHRGSSPTLSFQFRDQIIHMRKTWYKGSSEETTRYDGKSNFLLYTTSSSELDIRTTKGNYVAQKKGLRYCDLPLSFQHGPTVTRGLGIRYLWIDALCIVQDSQSDWELESGNMGAIYQHAYLVIGADMSSNSLGGFIDVQSGGYNGDGWPIATVGNDVIYARSEHNGNNDYLGAHPLSKEPLSDRAWTLQEQVLSSRMVHFALKEMVWECMSALCCECKQFDREGFASNPPLSNRTLMNSSSTFPARFRTWYKLVNEVAARSLTKSQDVLPCLSGIAKHFQDIGAGEYLAGLWREDLPMCLLWNSFRLGRNSRAITYRGPSWSWASVNRLEHPYTRSGGFTDHNNTLKKVYAKVIEAKSIPTGNDPLGAVSGGLLRVSAPLLKLESNLGINPCYDFDHVRKKKLFCLFIGEVTCGANGSPVRGLILAEAMDVELEV